MGNHHSDFGGGYVRSLSSFKVVLSSINFMPSTLTPGEVTAMSSHLCAALSRRSTTEREAGSRCRARRCADYHIVKPDFHLLL